MKNQINTQKIKDNNLNPNKIKNKNGIIQRTGNGKQIVEKLQKILKNLLNVSSKQFINVTNNGNNKIIESLFNKFCDNNCFNNINYGYSGYHNVSQFVINNRFDPIKYKINLYNIPILGIGSNNNKIINVINKI